MSVRFVLGRAGSGKTHYCLESIRSELSQSATGAPLIWLVPEQASLQADRSLLGTASLTSVFRAQVLSFRRLAHRVLVEVGGAVHPTVSPFGKQMLLRALLTDLAPNLQLFNKVADLPGFLGRLVSTLRELSQYGVDVEILKDLTNKIQQQGQGQTPLMRKVADLSVILSDYRDRIAGSFTDPDQHLDLLMMRLERSELVKGARVWVDGFSGFTPQEYKVLAALFRHAEQVEIALCLDPSEVLDRDLQAENLDESRLFHQTEETYLALCDIAKRTGAEILPPRRLEENGSHGKCPPRRFVQSPDLAHLERMLFEVFPETFEGVPPSIRLVEAADPRDEVNLVAAEILRLCREENYRFRDIAVIVRNLDAYSGAIEAGFGMYGIPVFVDRRRSISYHPLVELVRSAVRIVSRDWNSEAVFHYLKTDLVTLEPDSAQPLAELPGQTQTLSRDDVDELENYVLAHGIRGARWRDDTLWEYHRHQSLGDSSESDEPSEQEKVDLARINWIRAHATAALKRYEQSVRARMEGEHITVRDATECLYCLLEDIKVPETLERWARELETEATEPALLGNPREAASEHRQVWGIVVDILDDLVEALSDSKYTLKEYAEVLEAGLGELDLGMTPPKVDQVVVGSADRSRQPDLKAAFVLGLTEFDFPYVHSEDAIFSDDERASLKSLGVRLLPPTGTQLQCERYLGYIAFTRARDFLWLSYPAADLESKKKNLSPFIKQLLRCFPKLSISRRNESDPARALQITNPTQLAESLARCLRKPPKSQQEERWVALYNQTVQIPQLKQQISKVLSSLLYRNTPSLSIDLVEKHFGDRLFASVSALETYAACPFQHFCSYTLRLKERQRFKLEPSDLGTFYHAALSSIINESLGKKISEQPLEQIEQILGDAVQSLAGELKGEILLSSSRNKHITAAVNRILRDLLRALRCADERSAFVPAAAEIEFGGGSLPALRLDLEHSRQLILRGRIDRIDLARSEGGHMVARVLDYKMNPKRLSLCGIQYGLDLQLVTYLLVLKNNNPILNLAQPVEPVGAFYLPIQRKIKPVVHPESEPSPQEQEYYTPYKARGIFSADCHRLLESGVQKDAVFNSFYVNKTGDLGKLDNTDPVEREALAWILQQAEKSLCHFGTRILNGRIDIRPYRIGATRPCTYCRHSPVCRFEAGLQPYRELYAKSKRKILEDWKNSGNNTPLENSVSSDE